MSALQEREYGLVAIGCGPFNLSLMALASRHALDAIALDAAAELRWHPGLMLDDAQLQLSFLADLVSLIDPTHPLSFLAYLRAQDRLYPFFIREQFHPTRREYEDYLRWVVAQLPAVRFGQRVERVRWDAARERFTLSVHDGSGVREIYARDLVMGIGTQGQIPEALAALPPERSLHSGAYLPRRSEVLHAQHVTIIGSGQSGAEIALDVLRASMQRGPALSWLTRSHSFAPLDYSKLVLEMTTPSYVRYFHALPQSKKDELVAAQWQHYRGISGHTLEAIHDLLYQRSVIGAPAAVELRCGIDVEAAQLDARERIVLTCRHRDTGTRFEHVTSLVVAATGYRERAPTFLAELEPQIQRDGRGRLQISLDYRMQLDPAITGRIFVANAELHTHGVATPDLGMCAFRSATILNSVAGQPLYTLPERTAFTRFSPPTAAGAGA